MTAFRVTSEHAASLTARASEFGAIAEEITRDRLRHYGYTDKRIAEMEDLSHEDAGCVYEHPCGWVCTDENDLPYHTDRDELEQTAEFVVWVLEHPAVSLSPTHRHSPERECDPTCELVLAISGERECANLGCVDCPVRPTLATTDDTPERPGGDA